MRKYTNIILFLLCFCLYADNNTKSPKSLIKSTVKTEILLRICQLPEDLQKAVRLKFTAEVTDPDSDFIDFQMIDNGRHGIIEFGCTRIVFIDQKLETFRNGFIRIVAKANYTDQSTFTGEHVFMSYLVNNMGTHIEINKNITLLINNRVLKLMDKNILLDKKKKVIFVDPTGKIRACHINK